MSGGEAGPASQPGPFDVSHCSMLACKRVCVCVCTPTNLCPHTDLSNPLRSCLWPTMTPASAAHAIRSTRARRRINTALANSRSVHSTACSWHTCHLSPLLNGSTREQAQHSSWPSQSSPKRRNACRKARIGRHRVMFMDSRTR
jgi:hypothetical protein